MNFNGSRIIYFKIPYIINLVYSQLLTEYFSKP